MFSTDNSELSLAWTTPLAEESTEEEEKGAIIMGDRKLRELIQKLSPDSIQAEVHFVLTQAVDVAERADKRQMFSIKTKVSMDISRVLTQKETPDDINGIKGELRGILNRTFAGRIVTRWRVLCAEQFNK